MSTACGSSMLQHSREGSSHEPSAIASPPIARILQCRLSSAVEMSVVPGYSVACMRCPALGNVLTQNKLGSRIPKTVLLFSSSFRAPDNA